MEAKIEKDEKRELFSYSALTNTLSSTDGNLRTYSGISATIARTDRLHLPFFYLSLFLSLLLAAAENSFSTEPSFILAAYITALAENLISWQISLRAHSNFRV